jgi:hypothetical protein
MSKIKYKVGDRVVLTAKAVVMGRINGVVPDLHGVEGVVEMLFPEMGTSGGIQVCAYYRGKTSETRRSFITTDDTGLMSGYHGLYTVLPIRTAEAQDAIEEGELAWASRHGADTTAMVARAKERFHEPDYEFEVKLSRAQIVTLIHAMEVRPPAAEIRDNLGEKLRDLIAWEKR